MEETCILTAGGGVTTTPAVDAWVARAAGQVLASDKAPFRAKVWSYRHGGASLIACDIDGANRSGDSFTFNLGGVHDFQGNDPVVPDVAEALHMIGLLVKRLDATVQLGH